MSGALALAFSAGLASTLNPCGFAMLPAYLSYFMGIQDEERSRGAAMRSALLIGSIVSGGFLLVFGIGGVVIAAVSRTVATQWIPWLALAVGVGVAILGIAMLFGYAPVVGGLKARRTGGGYGNVFGFGISYAVASLSCTLPVFLSVVATQITARSFGGGAVVFVAYAAGMAFMLLGITVVIALGNRSLVNRLRGFGKYMNRISGVILLIAGGFIVWFWATSIGSGSAALGDSNAFVFVEDLSQAALNVVADNTLFVTLVLASIIVVAIGSAWFSSRRSKLTRGDGVGSVVAEENVSAPSGQTAAR